MRWVGRALALALFVGVLVAGWRFAAENSTPVRVHYLAGALEEVALWQVLLGSFACGAGLIGLVTLFYTARNGLIVRRYRKALGGLEAEVHQLRTLPLAPESSGPGDPMAAALSPPQGDPVGRGP
jgi:uncharacterized integral membrane protein